MKQLIKKFLEDKNTNGKNKAGSMKPPSRKCQQSSVENEYNERKKLITKNSSKHKLYSKEDHEGPKKKKIKNIKPVFDADNDNNFNYNERIFNNITSLTQHPKRSSSVAGSVGLQVVKNRMEMENAKENELFDAINTQDLNKSFVKTTGEAKKLLKMKIIEKKKAQSLPAKHPDAEARTVFVGNVDIKASRKLIEKFFSNYGKVETVRLRGIATQSMEVSKKEAITKGKMHPDRNTLIAYVRFKDIESKEKALEANGKIFSGLHLRVDNSIKSTNKNDHNSVFVGNLPWEVQDEDLWNLFQDCGKIVNVRLVRSAHTGAGKGIGFVSFEADDAIEMALQLNGNLIKNRPIRIKRISKKPKLKHEKQPKKKQKKQDGEPSIPKQNYSVNKMKLSFLKQDKPKRLRMKDKSTLKNKKQQQHTPAAIRNFSGVKVINKETTTKQRRPKFTNADRKKFALSKLLERAKKDQKE